MSEKNKDDLDNFQKWQLNFRLRKTGKSYGNSSKEYEPWVQQAFAQ